MQIATFPKLGTLEHKNVIELVKFFEIESTSFSNRKSQSKNQESKEGKWTDDQNLEHRQL